MKMTSKATLLAAVTGLVLAAQAQGAYAQRTLFDILFGNDGAPVRHGASAASAMPGAVGKPGVPADFDASDPDPLPTVKTSQYFTYKSVALRPVRIAALAGPVLTGAVAPDASQPLPPVNVSIRAEDNVAAAMETFYAKGDNYLWIGPDGVTDRARAAIGALAKAGDVGLNPEDYKVVEPEASTDPAQARQALMTFEVSLTKAVLTFVQDDVRGRIDPNRISDYYDFKRKDVNLTGVLNIIQHSPDVAAYLSSRSPQSAEFKALQAELMKLSGTAPQTQQLPRIDVADGTFIRPGGSSAELANIIELVKRNGSDSLKAQHEIALTSYLGTPDYAPDLVDIIKDFQQEKGLKPDGVIGRGTIRALQGGESQDDKVSKLVYAMEELRWLPVDLGSRRVFINQPAYMAYYFNEGKQQLAMKVVVGQVGHQTNFFQNQIQTVEFNPYWGVPRSIIVNEMMPKLRQDPSYLDRMGYEVSIRGKVVSSSSLDWGRNPDVDVRQPPGNANALGQLKILFPNKFSIYMHDTPQKSFFARDVRALSHGCVRLSDPRAMAAAVLGTTVDKVAANIDAGKNMQVQVPQKIPVYVAYFTAWPDAQGNVQFFDDVYKRDMYLQRAIDATSKARAQG